MDTTQFAPKLEAQKTETLSEGARPPNANIVDQVDDVIGKIQRRRKRDTKITEKKGK
jgi:hypothetical protein